MKGFLTTSGPKPPRLVYAFIEVPRQTSNKYEWEESLNAFVLDRVLYSSVFYPTEYGFIPATKAGDG
ncbi:inorganic diphosphatase, partial [Candidatus Shapirobacteria bacterium]|nr:inorganic diphosphatase [Candidatus Shapirobacteria bacterium]